MTKRTKRNLIITVTFAITIILAMTTLHTMFVGAQLLVFSNDVVESTPYASYNAQSRIAADKLYNNVDESRNELYNAGGYTEWLCYASKATSLFVGITLIALTVFFANLSWNILKRLARVRG